jgi:hypothetical protein
VVSASCGIGRGTIHHRLQAHWIASRRCSPGSCAAVSGRSSTHRIPEPRACTTCRLVFSIQGRRAVCNISCKRRRFFESLHSFAVSGLGLGPFDSLNMLLRSRVDDVPDLDSADDAAMDRRIIRPTRLVPPLGPTEIRQDRLQTPCWHRQSTEDRITYQSNVPLGRSVRLPRCWTVSSCGTWSTSLAPA